MPTSLSDIQLSSLDGYLNGKQQLPEAVDTQFIQSITSKLSPADALAKISTAFAELKMCQAQLAANTKPEALKVSQATDALLNFSAFIQSRLVAARTINSADAVLISEDIAQAIDTLLHATSATQLQASKNPEGISQYQAIADTYNRRAGSHAYLLVLTQHLLSYQIVRQGEENQENPKAWTPLVTLQKLSVGELLRIIIRSAVVDPQVDQDIDSLLFNFAKAVHLEWSPPIAPQLLLWKRTADLYAWVGSQEIRDRIGASFSPYFMKLLNSTGEAYDPEFHVAFAAMLQAVQLYYQSMPAAAATVATAPLQVPTTTPAPAIPTPESQPAQQIPINKQPPIPTNAPTIDFRHPDEPASSTGTSATPPANPQPDEPKIKPINIQ